MGTGVIIRDVMDNHDVARLLEGYIHDVCFVGEGET